MGQATQTCRTTLRHLLLGSLALVLVAASHGTGAWTLKSSDTVHWWPAHARFAPDGKKMAVMLCHYVKGSYCKLLEYWPEQNRWETLPLPAGKSYRWPSYSPDGKKLVFSQGACDEEHRCEENLAELATYDFASQHVEAFPVMGAVRFPSYSPDGRQIAYWRIGNAGRLASGRAHGTMRVYEWNTADEIETSPRPYVSGGKNVTFGDAYSGPRYIDNGRQLLLCGYVLSMATEPKPNSMDSCFKLNRKTGDIKLIDSRSTSERPASGLLFLYRPDLGYLGEVEGGLGFIDLSNMENVRVTRMLLPRPFPTIAVDMAKDGKTVVAVWGAWRNATLGRYKSFQHESIIDGTRTPILCQIDAKTGAIRTIEWPNPEDLPYRRSSDSDEAK